MQPCAPCTKGTAWSGEWLSCTGGTASVSGPSGVRAAQGLVSHHHRNGKRGCSEREGLGWGVGLPFRLQLLFSVQETHFSAWLGRCSEDTAPGAENPLFPAAEQKAPLSLPENFCTLPSPMKPCVSLPWALDFPCPPWAPWTLPWGRPSGHSRPGHWSPVQPAVGSTPTPGGGSGLCCVQLPAARAPALQGAAILPHEHSGFCLPLLSWSPRIPSYPFMSPCDPEGALQ